MPITDGVFSFFAASLGLTTDAIFDIIMHINTRVKFDYSETELVMRRHICNLISLIIILSLLLCAGACKKQDEEADLPSGEVGDGSGDLGPTDGPDGGNGGEKNESTNDSFTVADDVLGEDQEADFEALFNYANHVSLKLDIPDSELRKIQDDYEKYSSFGSKSPIYRKANLYVTIRTVSGEIIERVIGEVGVRMKGNTSRTDFYSDSEGMYNLIHLKLSFGETFDEEEYYGSEANVWESEEARDARKDRTFATLEKIDIRWNRNDDPTFIREIYCYDIYRELGLLAPHTNLASVDIGDDHAGLFVINEPIDKIFLEKNLPKSAAGGDLYKLGWTNEGATFTSFTSVGKEDEDKGKFYIYDIKTNKKTTDHSSLRSLIEGLNSSDLTKEGFAEIVDVDSFLKFAAASYMIGNPDDLRNNYNNCYIYFMSDTGRAILIPYDLDRGLGVNTWNPYGNGMTTENPFGKYNVQGDQRNPLFTKSIISGGFYVDEFAEVLKQVAVHPIFDPESFGARFDQAKALYSAEASPSKTYKNAERYSFTFDIDRSASPSESANMSFADYITLKKATLEGALNGETTDDVVRVYDLYIRADFTGWQNDEAYKMTECEGGYTVTLTQSGEFRFKIYDNVSGSWFGAEVVREDCEVEISTDKHTNVVLPAGSYTVIFNVSDRSITLIPA